MKLSMDVVNGLVDDLSFKVSGGQLTFYDTDPGATFTEALAVLTLRAPAFEPAVNGRSQVLPLEPVKIAKTGIARSARLTTASGALVAIFSVAEAGTEAAIEADIVMDRLDLSRDGLLAVRGWSLRLPVSS